MNMSDEAWYVDSDLEVAKEMFVLQIPQREKPDNSVT